ncbi:DUF2470 domain-containing protein [Streptomyces nitrosporeus]|uniref:DUF2470 domain-containing protein n=1 Tax=Streptomyces nitrosporeus TaxID=28894 RepID=A0A5J6FK86_9ACTN|nr:DUF2470 domain-containing protein [Streptomyces nitrosporeus]QEU75774.1 DUF2470 domain-containing protein [Streptomyces nitrosporeus]GGY88031.1 hypothetical protein GCM10010327_18420 [Streptomyces nitrosporeus]
MRPSLSRVTHPSPAERVLSVLTAAHSMTVVSDGREPVEVHRLDGSRARGLVHLHEPSGSGPGARVPVRLEFTDIAPAPVRDRLRARVTVTGLLAAPYGAEAGGNTCVEFGRAVVEDGGGRTFVTLDELRDTDPDPIATGEAAMLTHLLDGHGELVPLLLRLVQPQPDKGAVRVLPLAMDRYGLTLRLEYPGTHRDARLPFAKPVTRIDQAGPRIHALLSAARRASHRNRLPL